MWSTQEITWVILETFRDIPEIIWASPGISRTRLKITWATQGVTWVAPKVTKQPKKSLERSKKLLKQPKRSYGPCYSMIFSVCNKRWRHISLVLCHRDFWNKWMWSWVSCTLFSLFQRISKSYWNGRKFVKMAVQYIKNHKKLMIFMK